MRCFTNYGLLRVCGGRDAISSWRYPASWSNHPTIAPTQTQRNNRKQCDNKPAFKTPSKVTNTAKDSSDIS